MHDAKLTRDSAGRQGAVGAPPAVVGAKQVAEQAWRPLVARQHVSSDDDLGRTSGGVQIRFLEQVG